MNLITTILGGLKPLGDIIDNVVTTKEEKLTLRNELRKIEVDMLSKSLDFEKERIQSQAKIITSESTGKSWLQRNWRPITMLTFLILVVCDSFGLLKFRLSNEAWSLLQIGLGGYVVGRSCEKIIPNLKNLKREK